jgi:calcineurin-like phosphoesterase
VDRKIIIDKFITHMPARFEVAKGATQFNAVCVKIDENTGKALKIDRISRIVD